MGIADRLFLEAQQFAGHHQGAVPHLERDILNKEARLKEAQTALHLARLVVKRAGDLVPARGADFYCPICWVTKEVSATLRPIPGDIMRCNVCERDFQV